MHNNAKQMFENRYGFILKNKCLAHAAGSGGCDNDIIGDIGKNVSFCNICDSDRACGRYVAETLQCSLQHVAERPR